MHNVHIFFSRKLSFDRWHKNTLAKELHQFTFEELIAKSFAFFQLEVKDHIREAQKKKVRKNIKKH